MDVRLSAAIQHHPARAHLLPRLLESLRPLSVQIARDPDPDAGRNPWRTYRHALELTPAWATHRLIVQDDALVCRSFAATLQKAVEARPDVLIACCICGRPQRSAQRVIRACERGESWAEIDTRLWVATIALLWPVRLVAPALELVGEKAWPRQFTADDEIVGRVMRGLGERVLATVPSLIEHQDLVPSLIGRRAAGGRDRGRVAACYIDADCDPIEIDWMLGPL